MSSLETRPTLKDLWKTWKAASEEESRHTLLPEKGLRRENEQVPR